MLTLKDARIATRLTALPNVCMLALLGMFYFTSRSTHRAGDDFFVTGVRALLEGAMLLMGPAMLLCSAVGFAFSFQRIVSRAEQLVLWIIHSAAAAAALWMMVTVANVVRELSRWSMH